jgi:hypothetical protein
MKALFVVCFYVRHNGSFVFFKIIYSKRIDMLGHKFKLLTQVE